MFQNKITSIAFLAAIFVVTGNARAQNIVPQGPGVQPPVSGAMSLKPAVRVQLVITRYEGDRKLGSLPYTFVAAPASPGSNSPMATRIRLGVDTPIPADGGDAAAVQYKNVGTNIDSSQVTELPDGRYQLTISAQNTAAVPASTADTRGGRPVFRRFDVTFTAALRDGQTMQAISSADPVTGELIRVDVTINVLR
jgi:hypothetical protein